MIYRDDLHIRYNFKLRCLDYKWVVTNKLKNVGRKFYLAHLNSLYYKTSPLYLVSTKE